MPYPDAIKTGAIALFGEKYADEVRVLRMGGFSTELCGGTHADRTGDIGLFRIISEGGVAAGVRRIEGVTGAAALALVQSNERQLKTIASIVKSVPEEAGAKVEQLSDRVRALEKELQVLKSQLAGQSGAGLADDVVEIEGIKVVSKTIAGADVPTLRGALDRLKDSLEHAVIVLATVEDSKVRLIAGVTKSLTDRISAGELVNFVAKQVDGKGGGRADMAQAGGNDPSKLEAALASVLTWVRDQA
jgi:alanyl-tRNA synthetase